MPPDGRMGPGPGVPTGRLGGRVSPLATAAGVAVSAPGERAPRVRVPFSAGLARWVDWQAGSCSSRGPPAEAPCPWPRQGNDCCLQGPHSGGHVWVRIPVLGTLPLCVGRGETDLAPAGPCSPAGEAHGVKCRVYCRPLSVPGQCRLAPEGHVVSDPVLADLDNEPQVGHHFRDHRRVVGPQYHHIRGKVLEHSLTYTQETHKK